MASDLRAGDRLTGSEEFQRFFAAHHLVAYRLAYGMTRNHHLAEEVVQEAFFRAYRSRGRLREGLPIGPWFAKILVNVTRSLMGRRSSLPEVEAKARSAGAASPGIEVGLVEQIDLQQALDQLVPIHVEVLLLRYYLDYSEAQMAEALGIPRGTVKSRLTHARRQLAGILNARNGGEAGAGGASASGRRTE